MIRFISKLACALAVFAVAALPVIALAQAEKPYTIVLVHGAFVDASGWQKTYDILTKDGYQVIVVQNPTLSLDGDVQTTERAIALARHPVILVGHSYGGAVITEAGADPKVVKLVYIAAFSPDVGETVLQLAERPSPGEPGPPLLPPRDGFLFVDPAQFPNAFAAGADPDLTHFMAAAQMPWGLPCVQTKITVAAWKSKPTYILITTKDHMIPPETQEFMAKRADPKAVERVASSHAVMLTYPAMVAAFIESAASN